MTITIADLERIGQEYPIETASALAVEKVPSIPVDNQEIEYLSLKLNGRHPFDSIIIAGLRDFKTNNRSVSGLVRLLLYHYFTLDVERSS